MATMTDENAKTSCFWSHRWSKWTDNTWSQLVRGRDDGVVGLECVQERRCEKCNALQLKSVQTRI